LIPSPTIVIILDVYIAKASSMKFLFFILCLLFSIVACEDPEVVGEEKGEDVPEFVFGWSFGECGGDCATLYRLFENEFLYPDNEDGYMPAYEDVKFQDVALDNVSAVAKAKTLLEDFPDFLIETTDTIFGCPDCGDWGAIHIMLEIDGEERWWTLDNQIDGNPEGIQVWTQRVQDLIIELGS